MTLDLLEPRTEPRWLAHSPQWPAPTEARPASQVRPPAPCEPAAHALSPAWAAPHFDTTAAARVAEANAQVDEPGARLARTLCVLVRCALEQPDEARGLIVRFAGAAVARTIRRDVAESWALRRIRTCDLDTAEIAALGVAEIALQRALYCGRDPATSLITRELAFGLLRALGVPASLADAYARDAVLEILSTPL